MLPLYKEVIVGMDSYHDSAVIGQLAYSANVARTWVKGTRTVSLQLRGGGIVKSLNGFDKHNGDADTFRGMLEECAAADVTRPSSYSDIFHQRFFSPRIPYTVNHFFSDHFAGAWQEAREVGVIAAHLFKYDINSAYLWSGAQGLPFPASFYYTERLQSDRALYLLEIVPKDSAPFPFNTHSFVNAQREDVDLYGLTVLRVHAGVGWRKEIDGDELLRVTDRFSFGKQMGRAYWGLWATRKPIKCRTLQASGAVNKEWPLRNPATNFIWAQVIINRVKRRVYSADPSPVHVFVDSVIVRKPLHTSDALGGWRLDGDYPGGLKILCCGWYGVPGGPLIKHAGSVTGLELPDEPPPKPRKKPLRISRKILRDCLLRKVK